MSKKHYRMIAFEIDSARSAFRNHHDGVRALYFLARNTADTLAEANPRFDRTRFLDACGFTADKQGNAKPKLPIAEVEEI